MLSSSIYFLQSILEQAWVASSDHITKIKSGIKPKCNLVGLGGGYYASGTDNLKRYLDSLPKTLYYNDYPPSNYDWQDRHVIKLWAVVN